MDISKFSVSELKDLKRKIPTEIKRRLKQEKKQALVEKKAKESQALADLRAQAKILGVKIVKTKNKTGAKKRTSAPVKYRHPSNSDLTWTGRGRCPAWVKEWENSGRSLSALTV